MAIKRAAPNWPLESRDIFNSVKILLEAGDYERAEELLQSVDSARLPVSDAAITDPLSYARRLCMGCCQARIEAHWHTRAFAEAQERELAFRRELRRLISPTAESVEMTPSGFDHPSGRNVTVISPEPQTPTHHNDSRLRRLFLRWLGIEHLAYTSLGSGASVEEARYEPTPADLDTSFASFLPENPPEITADDGQIRPTLSIYCLGTFKVYQNGAFIDSWSNGKSKCILKYLTAHRRRPVHKEILMDLFWPRADEESARNSLNVAMYHLRQTFSKRDESFPYVVFADDCYFLNPELRIWTDYDAFLAHVKSARNLERQGNTPPAIEEYRAAERVYQGDFLEEDRYADWPTPFRRQYADEYLRVLQSLSDHYLETAEYDACATTSKRLLAVDPCSEEAHRKLMRCYSRQGQRHLALRQFHSCQDALARELDVEPSLATRGLYERIRHLEPV